MWIALAERLENIDAQRFRTMVRNHFGESNNVPVIIIDGDSAPVLTGKRGGYFTRGGTRVDHPSAYSRKGWSNLVYRCSTLSITVGGGWRQ
jgi:hypothetical protein